MIATSPSPGPVCTGLAGSTSIPRSRRTLTRAAVATVLPSKKESVPGSPPVAQAERSAAAGGGSSSAHSMISRR